MPRVAPRLSALFDPVATLLGIVDLVNPSLPLVLSPSNVTVGIPIPMPQATASVNTSVELTATVGQGYSGYATVYYQRQDVAVYLAAGGVSAPTLDAQGLASWTDVFTALNARYNTVFTAVDIPAESFPLHLDSTTLSIPIGERSLLFTGSFVLTLSSITPYLPDILTVSTLNGLIAPPAPQLNAMVTAQVIDGLTLVQLGG